MNFSCNIKHNSFNRQVFGCDFGRVQMSSARYGDKKIKKLLFDYYTECINEVEQTLSSLAALKLCERKKIDSGLCWVAKEVFGTDISFSEWVIEISNGYNKYFGQIPARCVNKEEIIEVLQARIDILQILIIEDEEKESGEGYSLTAKIRTEEIFFL